MDASSRTTLPHPDQTVSSSSSTVNGERGQTGVLEGMSELAIDKHNAVADRGAGEPSESSQVTNSIALGNSGSTNRQNDILPSFTQPASPLPLLSSSHAQTEENVMSASTSSQSLRIPDSPVFPTVSSKNPSPRRPSLTPSVDGTTTQATPPRTHRISPGAKNYFPLVTTPSTKRTSSLEPTTPTTESQATPPALAPPVPSIGGSNRHSIFPVISKPSTRPTPSNVFPLVKSPSSSKSLSQSTNSTSSKMSANPYPFADPPYSPPPPQQRRPSLAASTTSSKSDSTTTSNARPREPSSSYSNTTTRSPRSVGRAPSVTSTTYSPTNRSNYAPSITPSSIAPSAEGPTSIFANPVGYKPRTLTGLLLPKPSASSPAPAPTSTKPKSKFSFFSSSSSKDKSAREREGVTAPAHLVAGPPRSNSNRVLDAALTTSQTWAIRRGEQMMAPSPMIGGGAFAYRPGHQVRREQAANAEGGAVEAEELKRRLEREEDKTVFTGSGGVSVFPTVKREV